MEPTGGVENNTRQMARVCYRNRTLHQFAAPLHHRTRPGGWQSLSLAMAGYEQSDLTVMSTVQDVEPQTLGKESLLPGGFHPFRPNTHKDFANVETNLARSPTDAVITIRVIKSFTYRTTKNLVLKGVDLTKMTIQELEDKCRSGAWVKPRPAAFFLSCPERTVFKGSSLPGWRVFFSRIFPPSRILRQKSPLCQPSSLSIPPQPSSTRSRFTPARTAQRRRTSSLISTSPSGS